MRLLTRSDFDGLACGALLKEVGVINEWKFVHPKDVQEGLVEVTSNDVLANIPYVPGCGMWFDHHTSEEERNTGQGDFEGESRFAPSAARIIYDYYGGDERFNHTIKDMILYVDRVDSGQLKQDEILNPRGWILMGFIMDPRTGLGRFREFRIPNYQLMEILMDKCRVADIDEILQMPDVKERADKYFQQAAQFTEMLKKYTALHGNVILTDLRNVETIYTGNRFLIYSLFPDQNISMWVVDGRGKQNCPIAVGHSIINRTSQTDVGSLMLRYGGGGHPQVGTCQVKYEDADRVIQELLAEMMEG